MIANFIDKTVANVTDFDINGNVVTLVGNIPQNTSGFYLSRDNYNDDWDYTAYTTIYRVIENGVQFSNDGSVWVEPVSDITVSLLWDDHDDKEGLRPESVAAVLVYDGTVFNLVFNELNEWKQSIGEKPTRAYSLTCDDIPGYEQTISGFDIIEYHKVIDSEPSLEDRVTDLEIAVCEIAEAL